MAQTDFVTVEAKSLVLAFFLNIVIRQLRLVASLLNLMSE